MKTNKCPCEDCITFPICKTRVNKNSYIPRELMDNCELIKDYLIIDYEIDVDHETNCEWINFVNIYTIEKIFKTKKDPNNE